MSARASAWHASLALALLAGAGAAPAGEPGEADSHPLFSRLDADGNGYISAAEARFGELAVTGVFRRLDADGDALLSPQEFAAADSSVLRERSERSTQWPSYQ